VCPFAANAGHVSTMPGLCLCLFIARKSPARHSFLFRARETHKLKEGRKNKDWLPAPHTFSNQKTIYTHVKRSLMRESKHNANTSTSRPGLVLPENALYTYCTLDCEGFTKGSGEAVASAGKAAATADRVVRRRRRLAGGGIWPWLVRVAMRWCMAAVRVDDTVAQGSASTAAAG
jgi:hypothetical protein